ncbi:MAG: hypothetical protein N2B05_07760, partial [Gemmatimonadales bacterium]
MYRSLRTAFVTLTAASLALATAGYALEVEKEPPTARDSLVAELRALTARLDSLERVVAELRAAQQDTTEAVDELEALRAAANAAAAAAGATDTTAAQAGDQVTGARSLNKLNP